MQEDLTKHKRIFKLGNYLTKTFTKIQSNPLTIHEFQSNYYQDIKIKYFLIMFNH